MEFPIRERTVWCSSVTRDGDGDGGEEINMRLIDLNALHLTLSAETYRDITVRWRGHYGKIEGRVLRH